MVPSNEVKKLAQLVYDGEQEDATPMLYDALYNTGNRLAEHFRDPVETHFKGCWALDVLLDQEQRS